MLFYFTMLVVVYVFVMCIIKAVTSKEDKPVHPREDRPPPSVAPPPIKHERCCRHCHVHKKVIYKHKKSRRRRV